MRAGIKVSKENQIQKKLICISIAGKLVLMTIVPLYILFLFNIMFIFVTKYNVCWLLKHGDNGNCILLMIPISHIANQTNLISGIVPIYCENLFKQIDEKKAGGATEQFEVGWLYFDMNM